jgi:hypothetical protein
MFIKSVQKYRFATWCAVVFFIVSARSQAMSTSPGDAGDFRQPPAPTHEVPLRFIQHNFAAHCYNAIGCRVGYNGRYQIDNAPDEVSPPPAPDWDHVTWGGGEGPIRNFPPPAEVTWKSLDGVAHHAKVDMAAIFKEGLIWHNVPKADMAEWALPTAIHIHS